MILSGKNILFYWCLKQNVLYCIDNENYLFIIWDFVDRKKAGVVKEAPQPNPEIIICYVKKLYL